MLISVRIWRRVKIPIKHTGRRTWEESALTDMSRSGDIHTSPLGARNFLSKISFNSLIWWRFLVQFFFFVSFFLFIFFWEFSLTRWIAESRDDMVYDELKTPKTEMPSLPVDEDLPGMGQFYCLHCEYVFPFVTFLIFDLKFQ